MNEETINNLEINIFNYCKIKLNDNTTKIIFDIKLKENELKQVPNVVETKIVSFLNKYIDYVKIINNTKIIIDLQFYDENVLKLNLNRIINNVKEIYFSLLEFMENNIFDIHNYYVHYLQFCINENIEINTEKVNTINNLLKNWINLKKNVDKLINKFFKALKDLNESNLTKNSIKKIIKKVNSIINLVKNKMNKLQFEYYYNT